MINLKQLAELAGVDVSTVSRALNDSERVKPQTKAYIKSLAEKHHYVPNDMARSLVGKKNDTIGVLVPELINTFYAEVIEGIETACGERGYSLMFGKSRFNDGEEIKLIDLFMRRRVDGIILCSSTRKAVDHLRKLKRSVPVVITDTFEACADMDVVTIDHEYGVGGVIDHFLALGHREFGYIGDSKITPMRLDAFRRGLAERGAALQERRIFIGEERYEEGGYRRMAELLAQPDRPTAVFVGTDNLAIGAVRAARESGLRVPDDMSVVGFDDIIASAYAEVPLTTVLQPKQEMGRLAGQLLLARMDGEAAAGFRQVVLKPELIVRQSTGAAPIDINAVK